MERNDSLQLFIVLLNKVIEIGETRSKKSVISVLASK
jgi:hypothetical protein